MMRREDFNKMSAYLCEALDYIEDDLPLQAKETLDRAIKFLDEQQFNKPRGNPFTKGEDSRRKDRVLR